MCKLITISIKEKSNKQIAVIQPIFSVEQVANGFKKFKLKIQINVNVRNLFR
jgi:hypothetical protein